MNIFDRPCPNNQAPKFNEADGIFRGWQVDLFSGAIPPPLAGLHKACKGVA